MAGGKETPRQKMIGMMYLVLTALLALNVSKEVIAAFVSINDKLDASSEIINQNSSDAYFGFDQKKAALTARKEDLTQFNIWYEKSLNLKKETDQLVGFILQEANEMIKLAEGEDWIGEKNETGQITKLKPLIHIKNMDNYDVPTHYFVGSNPKQPNAKGKALRKAFHQYRDKICEMMGTYTIGDRHYQFTPPASPQGLQQALQSVNPKDTAKLKQFYQTLTLPEKLQSHDMDAEMMPWASVMFDHAPVVAAASILNSLKLDIKNAESLASEYLLAKVKAPIFVFNKIEPLAFASTGYINQGDSLDLSIMIAAYDSTTKNTIRYALDGDTLPEQWLETSGPLVLSGNKPGQHNVKGVIGVKERGMMVWKPWDFQYTVGQPMGTIGMPEMRTLYRGYKNIVEGSASGYPSDKVTLSGNGCQLAKQGDQWIVTPSRGVRKANISIIGHNGNGTKTTLGNYSFDVRDLPSPNIYFGGIDVSSNPVVSLAQLKAQSRFSLRYGPEITLSDVDFTILEGSVNVSKIVTRNGKILGGGRIDDKAERDIRQAVGQQVSISIKYRDPSGKTKKIGGIIRVR